MVFFLLDRAHLHGGAGGFGQFDLGLAGDDDEQSFAGLAPCLLRHPAGSWYCATVGVAEIS